MSTNKDGEVEYVINTVAQEQWLTEFRGGDDDEDVDDEDFEQRWRQVLDGGLPTRARSTPRAPLRMICRA